MQRTIKMAALAAATLVIGTAAASAQGYARYNDSMAFVPPAQSYDSEPVYGAVQAPAYAPGPAAWGRGFNGTNHPTPGSTQGDVGPQGNNNGTQTGIYRQW
ncbi:conserved exported protein of unknown function [Bradyrhizobium sp. ORS 285]|uniref:hypothetical protein n=1 Tax=Bradyrhizobium sp. ORS 285 TaxID=115808 RepID=UPI00024099C9|nr:hypothetical protein [Bradyrhizobium sp. ORS 285]CCD84019.1 conserved exported hypothetical protein [Bradyrhizobium sp. ORS 285]SMX58369.1 conserved exported protein of unknown function [Bradyrhizobium sp. ORS 285]